MLTVIDEYSRECLTIEVQRRFRSQDVLDVISDLFITQGVPEHIRSDNGPEFIAKAIERWLKEKGIKTLYVYQDSPGRTDTPRASTAESVRSTWTAS